jgi:hypothetical protein
VAASSDNDGGTPTGQAGEPSPSPAGNSTRPLGQVFASAIEGFRTLLRQQIELAKLELLEAIAVRTMGVGMMVGAAVLAIYAVGFVAGAIVGLLALVMPTWVANLVVALLLLAVAGVLVVLGRRTLLNATTGERTRDMLKEDARWAKQQIAR